MRRLPEAVVDVDRVRYGELVDLYDRLGDAEGGGKWRLLFGSAAELAAAAAVGAGFSNYSKLTVVLLGVLAGLCLLAWLAVRDTEGDSITTIRRTLGRILDSQMLVAQDADAADDPEGAE
jgi:hypothetical protein